MAEREKPLDQQLWANLDFIRSLEDQKYVIDVLTARRDFLRLRRREEVGIRAIYIQAADRVAADLIKLKPGISGLTRNHMIALERSLRREADAIGQTLERRFKDGVKEATNLAGRAADNHFVRAVKQSKVPLDVVKIQRGFGNVNTAAAEAFWSRSRNGLRVSDRIWNTSQKARESMRNLIQVGIATGRDATSVAKDLERYVRSGIGSLSKDYPNMMIRMEKRIPKNLNYEALRLVRTEYSNAFMEGTYARGRANPSYEGSKWMLSDAHPLPDICDELATADLYDMGPGVYPKGEEPTIPHPNCLCTVIAILIQTDRFVDMLIEWGNNPPSQPGIEDWYQNVYMQAA